jgi:hypothetical protein
MKNSFLLYAVLLATYGNACDVCGGMSSTASFGILAPSRFHIFTLKSELRTFTSFLHGIQHSKEFILRSEISGRFQLHDRLNVFVSLPFQSAWQRDDFGTRKLQGLGDVQTVINGVILDRRDSLGQVFRFFSVGGGLKNPTGKSVNYPDPQKNMYPGTGSFDLLLLTNYIHRWSTKWSSQLEYSHSVKGKDKEGFRYGQSGSLALHAIRSERYRNAGLLVLAGTQFDWNLPGTYHGNPLYSTYSEGWQLAIQSSLNVLYNNWMVSIGASIPIVQYWFAGNVRQQPTANASIHYLLSKKKK